MNRIVLAIISGLLLALGWPTYGFPLLLFFGFVPLLLVEFQLRKSNAKRIGLKVFGFAYISFLLWNLITTNWLVYASVFGAAFAIFVNSALMALLFVLYHKYAKRFSLNRSLLFLITLWLSFEKLHLGWEFSWPWLNLGNGFSEYVTWIQWYEYTGTFGGSLWVLLGNILFFKGILKYQNSKSKKVLKTTGIQLSALLIIPILISTVIYSNYDHQGETVNVMMLQPNIDPYSEKYDISNLNLAEQLFDLSNPKISDSLDFLIAPETVFAQSVRLKQFEKSLLRSRLEQYISSYPNLNFLTGMSFIDVFRDESKVRSETNQYNENTWYDDYNSAILLNSSDSVQYYNKSKLVVGIENFPYQSILKPIIGDAMIDLGGTVAMKTTQDYRGVFISSNGKYKAGPIICYESAYGEFVTGYIRNDANFLAIITNDAWWNETQGHKQHLSLARLRAIETRRDIARSANTGISAIINSRGDIVNSLGYDKKGALLGEITTNDEITFYVRAGDYIARISIFIMLFVFLIGFFRKKRQMLN
ncbi:MAG: apolipoprotein N-acyltransferase [Psychroserpens sp.]|nr:apolipoprotein N-acyltransferase [Psychroserpens sp.]